MKLLEMCTDELKRRLPIDYKGVRSNPPIRSYGTPLTLCSGTGEGHLKGRCEGDGF